MTLSQVAVGIEGVRAALGALDLLQPDRLPLPWVDQAGRFPDAVYRVLGVRQAVQAALTVRAGSLGHRLGGSVDTIHALSMLSVAALSARYRRAALAQVVIACTLALAEFVCAANDFGDGA